MSFYEFKAPSGSEVSVTYEKAHDVPLAAIPATTTPTRKPESRPTSNASPSATRVTQSAAGSDQTTLDQCTEYLVSKAKLQRDRGAIRIAVHQFVPKSGPSDPSATYGDGISAAVERSMLRIQEVQVVTRRRLRDLQMEQKLNQAEWNESGEKDGRLGIRAVDFIVRGTYSGVSRSSPQTLEIELLEPRTGQIIAAKRVTLQGF
jgi:hypothetical protein